MSKRKQHRNPTAEEMDTLRAYADAVGERWSHPSFAKDSPAFFRELGEMAMVPTVGGGL